MTFLYNRVLAQRIVVVPKLFLEDWEGLVTLDKHGEQNYQRSAHVGLYLREKRAKGGKGMF